MEELIRFGKPAETKAGHLKSEFRPLFDEKAYREKVEQVKHYIHEGRPLPARSLQPARS